MSSRETGPQQGRRYNPHLLNQSINFFWTILCCAPVLWYWVAVGVTPWFFISMGAALGFGSLPAKVLELGTLSRNRRFYERLGVKRIRRYVQDGDAVRRLSRGRGRPVGDEMQEGFVGPARLIGDLDAARRYLRMIAMYERFHWIGLVFFLLTAAGCFADGRWVTGLLVTVANALFNVFAIMLQQYNRIRIRRVLG